MNRTRPLLEEVSVALFHKPERPVQAKSKPFLAWSSTSKVSQKYALAKTGGSRRLLECSAHRISLLSELANVPS